MENVKITEINIDGKTYQIGDYVMVEGHSNLNHKRVVRIDKIISPYHTFVCECENEKDIFIVNSVYIEKIATNEEINEEMNYRDCMLLTDSFSERVENFITYEWGEIDKLYPVEDSVFHPVRQDLYARELCDSYYICIRDYAPNHDGDMARLLGVHYTSYIKTLLKFKGYSTQHIQVTSSNDYVHSTNTFFKNRKDCEECIQFIKEYMPNRLIEIEKRNYSKDKYQIIRGRK